MDEKQLAALRALASELTKDESRDYKDDWELGHDAGTLDAGRRLAALLDAAGVKK